jgi:hypothetical protein
MQTLIDLTDRFPMRIDLERLRSDLALLENHKWIAHYDKDLADGWTAVPLVSWDGSMDKVESQQVGVFGQYKRTPIVEKLPYFSQILDAFDCPHGRIRIMKMLPGTIIRPHKDIKDEVSNFAFDQVRLHIPIVTNDKVTFNVDGVNLKLQPGRLYYVNFSKTHYVRNDGTETRTHLVLDLKVNDFLRKVFPELTMSEKIGNAISRTLLPIEWKLIDAKKVPARMFWSLYEGSSLQRLRHRLVSK